MNTPEIAHNGQPLSTENRNANESLTDNNLGKLLAAVGNSEAKAMTILLMQSGVIYRRYDINRAFMQSQGKIPGWKTNRVLQFGYCRDSFAPIGLVARETLNEDGTAYGYQITEYGQEFGKPLAALLLDFSRRYEISLYDIFGSTPSTSLEEITSLGEAPGKKRAPLTRLKIIRVLLEANQPVRVKDLLKELEEKREARHITGHIEQLSKRGLIDYETRGQGRPYVIYYLSPKHPKTLPDVHYKYRALTLKVYGTMLREPEKKWTSKELAEKVLAENPELYDSQRTLKSSVNEILAHLKRSAYVLTEKLTRENPTEISLSTNHRATLSELVRIVDLFQRKNPIILAEGKRLAINFLSDPRIVAELMKKAKEHAPLAFKDKEQVIESLMQIIEENPRVTHGRIGEILQEKYERILTSKTIDGYLRELQKKGKIKKVGNHLPAFWVLSTYDDTSEEKTGQESKILKTREESIEFPVSLEDRRAALFSAFNFGIKAVTLLLLSKYGDSLSISQLNGRLKQIFKDTYLESKRISKEHCELSLFPNGLVSRYHETNPLGYEKHRGYKLTADGQQFGVRAAALALWFEKKYGICLYEALGTSRNIQEHSHPGTLRRTDLLMLLSEVGTLNFKTLGRKLNIEWTLIQLYVDSLNKNHLITYDPQTSDIKITEKGLIFVRNYAQQITQLARGDTGIIGWLDKEIVPIVLANLEQYAINSAELYYPHSMIYKRKNQNEN